MSFEKLVDLIHYHAQEALDHPFVFKKPIKNVAVIGAGPHGLCSTRFLKESGMKVKVFEQTGSIGGVWKYDETIPPKPPIPYHPPKPKSHDVPQTGISQTMTDDATRLEKQPPSACYRDLMVNIPSKHFSFPDFPFPQDASVFPKHAEMLAYFQRYAYHFELMPLIELNTCVEKVTKIEDGWELILCRYESVPEGLRETRWRERFEAVVAASGLHQEPFVPDIKGLTEYDVRWPEKVTHSKQFRRPEDFKDKNVLIVGVGISGIDMARSLDEFAQSITMASRGPWISPIAVINSMRAKIPKHVVIKPEVQSFTNPYGLVDGTITFQDGTFQQVDSVIFCTGYSHSLSYMDPTTGVELGREYAKNAFHEVFLISDPTFCFMAMPRMFSITPYFYTQAVAIARVWSGQAFVPDCDRMAKLESEFNPGLPPDLCACDVRRREVFVSLLNYQAQKLQLDIPRVTNFDSDYEEEGKTRTEIWAKFADANFRQVKDRILLNKV